MNGITFQPGFAFCAQLVFLGMTAIVDFTATPKRGIKLYAKMQKAIRIGKVLEIYHVEDNTKGPMLSLSTYPENLYLYVTTFRFQPKGDSSHMAARSPYLLYLRQAGE